MSFEACASLKIGQFAKVKGGKRMPSGTALTPVKTTHPYLRIVDFKDGGIDCSNLQYVPEDVFPSISRYVISSRDLYISIVGTVGLVGAIPEQLDGANLTENAAKICEIDRTRITPKYLGYYLRSEAGQGAIKSLTVGSTQPKLALFRIEQIEVPCPSLSEQWQIASFLGALDDRITLLREANTLLEQIAQTIFKSWFVDFDPVRAKQEGRIPEGMDEETAALFPDSFEESELGMVPRGWKVMPLGEAVETVGGATPDTKNVDYWLPEEYSWTSPKDLSGLQAPVLLKTERKISASGLAKVSSGLLPEGTLLMSSRAPIGYLAITNTPMAINQGYIAMPPGSTLPPSYMLFWCQQNMEEIKNRANGSTFMEISKKAFRPIPVLVPDEPVLAEFVSIANSTLKRVIVNEEQAQILADLRDTLLPRLISGKLRLPEAETDDDLADLLQRDRDTGRTIDLCDL